MISQYEIEPVEIVVNGNVIATCTKMDVAVNYTLNATSMDASYSVIDYTIGYVGLRGDVQFDAANLAQWGTDDMYIVNQIAAAAGVTLI